MEHMKKLLIAMAFLFCLPSLSFGADSDITSTSVLVDLPDLKIIKVDWICATDNSFTNHEIDIAPNGRIELVVTDPGTTAPTDNYDIQLLDSTGVDIMGGGLADRDTANTEQSHPLVDGSPAYRPVNGKMTLSISNNSVSLADGALYIFVYPYQK